MMQEALTITSIMEHARDNFPDQEIVSLTSDNKLHRLRYKEIFSRTAQLANALSASGLGVGERVATLAWNDHRHFELYYAISSLGAVCHTVNPRLYADQISYIINHAEDKLLFVDPVFLPLIASMHSELSSVEKVIVLCDEDQLPDKNDIDCLSYESLIRAQPMVFDWPTLDEDMASSLCYTSGTTGNPKGVLYSHRSSVLHSYAVALPDVMNLSIVDCVLPVVPMFHANAWGLNYAVPMVGAKLVLPGAKAGDPEMLAKLMIQEKVTMTAGVPTVWLELLAYLRNSELKLDTVKTAVVGGAACPSSVIDEFRDIHQIETKHAWGMTELSPLGTMFAPTIDFGEFCSEKQASLRAKQGRAVFGVKLKIVNDDGVELPRDGTSFGSLKVKGPWVCQQYYKSELEGASAGVTDPEGWFYTGDVATIDEYGYMNIVDRTKDVIKSGGEWISSIQLESVAHDHKFVAEAAVIGMPHPKWTERPLLVVVLIGGVDKGDQIRNDILEHMKGKVVKWWIPEDVVFVNELPHTATGKISKVQLRDSLLNL